MKSTLQSKIASAMWVMTAVSTLASAILTGALLVSSHKESVRQQLQATATSLVSLGITHFSELKDFEEFNRFVEDNLQMDRVDKIIRIYNGSLKLIFTTAGADYDKLPDTLKAPLKKPAFRMMEGMKKEYESIIMPYEGIGNKKTFYLQVATPRTPFLEILGNLWWQSFLLMGILLGISITLSQWLSGRLLYPVGVIANHLQRMDPVKIEDWKPINLGEQGRYLGSIIEGINLLSERTRIAILRLRKMSRYVAHEMRTPLTILQGEAETVLLREDAASDDYEMVLKSSLEEIQRMSEIVNTVLQVGETAKVAPFMQLRSLDLVQWVAENRPELEKMLGRHIDFDLPSSPMIVRTDPKLLYRLVDNLIRNVKNHTPKESKCAIAVNLGERGIALVLSDDGPGVSPAVIESLNSYGSASDAAGVGLNLCYRIAEITGVKLRFQNRLGGGLEVDLRF